MASEEMRHGDMKIVVTNEHIDWRGIFIMHCDKLHISTKRLEAKDIGYAKIEAIKIVRARLLNMLSDLQNIEHVYL